MNQESFDFMQDRFQSALENFHQLCRFCMGTKGLLQIILKEDTGSKIMATFNEERGIGNLLEKQYLPFDLEEEFDLPNNICETCVDNLEKWHSFREAFTLTTKLLLKVRDQFHLENMGRDDPSNESISQDEAKITIDDMLDADDVYEIEYIDELPEDAALENVSFVESVSQPKNEYDEITKDSIKLHNSDESSQATMKEQVKKQIIRKRSVRSTGDTTQKRLQSRENRQCPVCGIIVKEKMKHHLMKHSDPTGRPFKCTECDKAYSFKRSLADHIRQIHQNVRYPCEICKKTFGSRDVLRIHKKLHSNEQHRCDDCGQVFQQRVYLKKHMAMHELKKFCCDECGKTFRFKELMKQHMRIHTGEKPFACKACEKCFRTITHLKQHQRSHTQERIFKCKLCTVSYASKSTLLKHIQLKHELKTR